MNKPERIDGTLTNPSGDSYPVRLNVAVIKRHLRVALKTRVPDGPYRLDYFYGRYRGRRVRVKDGRLRRA